MGRFTNSLNKGNGLAEHPSKKEGGKGIEKQVIPSYPRPEKKNDVPNGGDVPIVREGNGWGGWGHEKTS